MQIPQTKEDLQAAIEHAQNNIALFQREAEAIENNPDNLSRMRTAYFYAKIEQTRELLTVLLTAKKNYT